MAGPDWRRTITPALFTLGVAVNLAGLAAIHGRAGQPARTAASVFVVTNLLWLLTEAPVSFSRSSTPPREVTTLICYGTTRFATVAAAELPPPMDHVTVIREWVAFALFAGGIVLRLVAIRTLGRFYSHHVIRHTEHAIVTTGPYRLIRHPAYAGMLLAHVGLVLFFLNWYSLALFASLCVVVSWRIRVEERALWELPAYRTYAGGHSRLLPRVW